MLRELHEELGLTLVAADLSLLFVFHQNITDEASGFIENEFQWVYGSEVMHDVEADFQDGEVEAIAWVSLGQLNQLINGRGDGRIVPHGQAYFTSLLEQIDSSV